MRGGNLLDFTGLDPVTAYTAVIAGLNSSGPGMGSVGPAVLVRLTPRF